MRDTTSMEDSHQSRRRQEEPTVAKEEGEGGAAAASEDEEEDSSSDGEFEFPSVSRDWSSSADELFAGGRMQAFYPVFGRVLDEEAPAPRAVPLGRLFQLEQARTSSVASSSSSSSTSSSSSADAAGLDSASPDSYCLWTPGSSPASSPSRPPRKSGSTGSVARWRRIGDLVSGRSRSDGKDRFLFLSAPPSPARDDSAKPPQSQPPQKGKGSSKAAAGTELDAVASGRRMSGGYGYGGGGGGANNNKASNGGRRTFLPYRQDLVGLFASVHGLNRSPHPF